LSHNPIIPVSQDVSTEINSPRLHTDRAKLPSCQRMVVFFFAAWFGVYTLRMNRRRFLHLLEVVAAGTIGAQFARCVGSRTLLAAPKSKRLFQPIKSGRPQVAITMDDPSVDIGPLMTWHEANRLLLDTFSQRNLKIALFVCGMRVDHSEGQKLLSDWDKAGHLICNHSYSHLNFNGPKVTYERFASDFARNEPIL
jgi:peptidoglycan/xylan/chitin deacetylase (PgdA/CDA1 family)